MIVTIVVKTKKGNKAFNQPYNIEGTPKLQNDKESIMNFIYWLNETLKSCHGLDQKDFKNWPKDKVDNKFLWGNVNSNHCSAISF